MFRAPPQFWVFVEMSNKLLITGILGFVMPGTAAQIVAGNVLAFCVLILYLWFHPYREKAVFLVGFSAALVLSIFFYVALLIKTQVSYRRSLPCCSCEVGVKRANTLQRYTGDGVSRP